VSRAWGAKTGVLGVQNHWEGQGREKGISADTVKQPLGWLQGVWGGRGGWVFKTKKNPNSRNGGGHQASEKVTRGDARGRGKGGKEDIPKNAQKNEKKRG